MIVLRGVRPRCACDAASPPCPAYASTSVSRTVTPPAVSVQPSRPRAARSTGPASRAARLATDPLAGPVPPGVEAVGGRGELLGHRAGAGGAARGPGGQRAAHREHLADLGRQVRADRGQVLVGDLVERALAGRADDDEPAGDLVRFAER